VPNVDETNFSKREIFYDNRILRYARALALDEAGVNAGVAGRQSAAENGVAGNHGGIAGVVDVVVPLERTDHAAAHDVNAVFDDSDDDDLVKKDAMDIFFSTISLGQHRHLFRLSLGEHRQISRRSR
jgi:hypothetical protein